MNDAHPVPLVSCRRWFYQVVFAIARFLVVEQAYGISPHRRTRRREAVLSLGDPEQGPTRVRGWGRRDSRGRDSQGRGDSRRGTRQG